MLNTIQVVPSAFEEDLPHDRYAPGEYATATAKCKALDVAQSCTEAQLIIASDTVLLHSFVVHHCGTQACFKWSLTTVHMYR